MHFHFQCEFGAIFWMMPISAFCNGEGYDKLSDDEQTRLSLLQTWDCQSNNIAVTTFGFLQNKKVDVLCRDHKWRRGKYLFTIVNSPASVRRVYKLLVIGSKHFRMHFAMI